MQIFKLQDGFYVGNMQLSLTTFWQGFRMTHLFMTMKRDMGSSKNANDQDFINLVTIDTGAHGY